MELEKLRFRRVFKIHMRLSPHCYYLDLLMLEEKARTREPHLFYISTTSITSLSRDWPLTSTFPCVNSPQVSQKRNKKVTSYLCHKHTGDRGRATTRPQTTFLQVKLQIGPWTGMSAGNFSGKKKKDCFQTAQNETPHPHRLPPPPFPPPHPSKEMLWSVSAPRRGGQVEDQEGNTQ